MYIIICIINQPLSLLALPSMPSILVDLILTFLDSIKFGNYLSFYVICICRSSSKHKSPEEQGRQFATPELIDVEQ